MLIHAAQVFRVSLDEPLRDLEVDDRYREAHVVVIEGGSVVGELVVPGAGVIPADYLAARIATELGRRLYDRWLAATVSRALLGAHRTAQAVEVPRVSVVVCTHDRRDQLDSCLRSLLALDPPALELIVVDSCSSDDAAERLCASYPVRYLREPAPGLSRARNRGIVEAGGDLIAFTDDDCVVDPGWLRGLDEAFADPLVMMVSGYVAPLELETPAQYLFQAHGGFERHFEPRIFDGARHSPVQSAGLPGPGANQIYRRSVFAEIGLFAEDLGRGTPARSSEDAYAVYRVLAAGYRVAYDPSRIVAHRHRRDERSLRGMLGDDAAGSSAFLSRCLVRHREAGALRVWLWWWARHLPRDVRRALRGGPGAVPLRLPAWEALGLLSGPARLVRSRYARRGLARLELSARDALPRPAVLGERPPLSVAIASYNRRDKLRAVLESLASLGCAHSLEVVVVVDGSTDGSAEMARCLEVPYELRVLEQENRGLAASRNRGAREARHEVVVWLDDDIVPEPGFLEAHAAAHDHAKEPHVALGYYPPVRPARTLWAIQLRAWWEAHFRAKAEPDHRFRFTDFCDGNVSMPRSLFLSSGGWDEEFTGGRRQDWEYGVRLLQAGVRLAYYPAAMGRHDLDTSFDTAMRSRRQEARFDLLLARKHPHVRAELPLRAFAHDDRLRSGAVLAARRRTLDTLEALHLRARWRRLANSLLRDAYVLGLRDELSPSELSRLMAGAWAEPVEIVPVELLGGAGLELPRAAGPIELALRVAGRPAGQLAAFDDGPWSLERLCGHVAQGAGGSIREALALEQLHAQEPGDA
jgi:GT2 family glycosyltransferase